MYKLYAQVLKVASYLRCIKYLRKGSDFGKVESSGSVFNEEYFAAPKPAIYTLSRTIHTQISIPKRYQMMMSSVARVKFIKTKVIFRYHTRGVSNSSNSGHEIKSYSCSNCTTKMGKNEKVGENFLGYKMMQ